jgi:putative membrane protein
MNMTTQRIFAPGLMAALALTVSSLWANEHEKGEKGDNAFIKHAAQCNLMEVKAAQLGSDKGQSQEVKRFSEKLVKDHGQAMQQIRQLAQTHNVTLPTELDAKQQAKLDKLQAASGAEFDKDFARCMVKDHAKAVAKYEKASQKCEAADVKSYAQTTLPALREHLRMAKDLARSVGLDEAAIAAAAEPDDEDAVGGADADAESAKGTGKRNEGRIDDVPKDDLKQKRDDGRP